MITDLKGQNAIWSAGDIADCLFLAPAKKASAEILVDLHPIVNRIREWAGLKEHEITWKFLHTYDIRTGTSLHPLQERNEADGGSKLALGGNTSRADATSN
jgi:hypothetical protein